MQVTQETRVQPLGWEDPLEEGMATHPSILAWRIPMDRGAWWATVHEVAKSWYDQAGKHFGEVGDTRGKLSPVHWMSQWNNCPNLFGTK